MMVMIANFDNAAAFQQPIPAEVAQMFDRISYAIF